MVLGLVALDDEGVPLRGLFGGAEGGGADLDEDDIDDVLDEEEVFILLELDLLVLDSLL